MQEKKRFRIAGYIGLLASLLMFAGDMLLYFTTQPFGDLDRELLPSMGSIPSGRMFIGGLLGPLAACLYLVGFYHVYLAVKIPRGGVAKSMLIFLAFALVVGGAYHSLFPAFGIVATQGHPELIGALLEYAKTLGLALFLLIGIGWLLFIYLVLRGRTLYPRWIIFVTPVVSVWLGLVWEHLPQPILIVLAGGWNSLVFTLFFATSLLVSRNKRENKRLHHPSI